MGRFLRYGLGFALIVSIWFWWMLRPVGLIADGPVVVRIEQGDSFSHVTSELKLQRIIRSSFAFSVYGRLTGASVNLKPGSYEFTGKESVSEILDAIRDGRITVRRVTIPEGLTVAQIDALMASKGLGKEGDILHCAFTCDFSTFEFLPSKNVGTETNGYGSRLEGYLFPETYAISEVEYVPKFFLELMLGEFRRRVIVRYGDEIAESGRSLGDTVTMASLIEEETRKDEERATVSGILWKRLDNRIVLAVDATTRYELQKPTAPLLKTELESDHAYNTRRKLGLPPSSIANPGEASIVAAIRPESSDYWYYLHDSTGVIRYAVTNDEHNLNKAKYLR